MATLYVLSVITLTITFFAAVYRFYALLSRAIYRCFRHRKNYAEVLELILIAAIIIMLAIICAAVIELLYGQAVLQSQTAGIVEYMIPFVSK